MPEYLAPGVYVEETSFRSKSLEGVSTSTAGFVGPCRYGPTEGEPELLTSFSDFERIYGGLDQLMFNGSERHNYLAHAVRAFFEEGGKRLYVARIYNGSGGKAKNQDNADITLEARFPGVAGNVRVSFNPVLSQNLLIPSPSGQQIKRLRENDTALIKKDGANIGLFDVVEVDEGNYTFKAGNGDELKLENGVFGDGGNYHICQITVDVSMESPIRRPKRPAIKYTDPEVIQGLALHPAHGSGLTRYFSKDPSTRLQALTVPFSLETKMKSGAAIGESLFGMNQGDPDAPAEPAKAKTKKTVKAKAVGDAGGGDPQTATCRLDGGNDGPPPGGADYQGSDGGENKSGLIAFEDIEDISIIAAPGYSYKENKDIEATQGFLISHCERMRYRIAVLDSVNSHLISEVSEARAKIDSSHAAYYYPWIRVLDPITEEEILLPPSGFTAGIYARNDVTDGVHKAPANEVVRLAIGFEFLLNKSQQDVLNPQGVNCFRFFEGRGYRLWGARTATSDPEWKYVNLRRYFAFLERSIEKGTQWVVFENNNDQLWYNVRRTVEDFLFNEWKSGHLLGTKPAESYFVRCDRTTMTQNDLDNGRLICLIGVSPVRPAEFVIFRIGQWTADSPVG